jgi:TolA-binding protein
MTFSEKAQQRSVESEPIPAEQQPASGGTARWVAVVLALLAILVTTALWLSSKSLRYSQNGLRFLQHETQTAKTDNTRLLNALAERLTQVQNQNENLRREVSVLTDKLEATQDDAQVARKQLRRVRVQELEQGKQLTVVNTDVREQLDAKANTEDLRTVNSAIASVRDEIKTTKSDLQMSRSELGTLIARNHDEIETLRGMGERNYFEFTIKGKNASEKMGDITITLRGTDPKKNECNLELSVDDRRTEKRNRAINEPILFYREQERRPVEIVVNQIARNEVVGYLSVPKERQQPTIAGAN